MRRVTADARKVYMLTCVFLLGSGPFHNDSCKSYIHKLFFLLLLIQMIALLVLTDRSIQTSWLKKFATSQLTLVR